MGELMEDKSRIWGISDVKAFLISIITGFILVTIVAVIFTEISNETVNKTADRVLDFVQTRVNTYEYFIQNDKVKSLYRLSDKTQELVRCMQYEDDIDTFLDEYMYNQRLDGIVVLDGEGECEYYRGIEYTDVDSVIDDSNVKDVIEHPQKVYITRVNVRSGSITYTESQNEEFSDIAVAARKDTKGAVITYVKKESYDNSGDISIDRLISGFEFDMDGIVYISDENKVLNSNDEELQGLDMKALRQKYDGAWKENDNGIIAVPYKKDYYYGKRKQIENYTIYAFFADKQVYALRNRAVAAALFVYIAVIGVVMFVRQLVIAKDESKMQLQEMEYKRQLLQAAEQEKRANIAKTDFLRRMSHDIRTPINGIRGMVDICRFNLGNREKEEECLDKIMSASGFLLDLVNDVLDMNKLEIAIKEEPFELTKIINEVSSVIETQADEQCIDYSVDRGSIEYDNLIGSSLHLRQILQNILSNAIKYNVQNGSVRFSYSENAADDDIVKVTFICKDTGIGMSEEFQQIAFEPFAQESSNARTAYKGTGLGLAITKRFIEIMGGEIEFISRQNVGTEFTIILPFKINRNVTKAKNSKCDAQMSIEGLKVLVAEDNEMNMEIVSFILDNAGARTVGVSDGREALDTYMNSDVNEYDVILLDIMMPVMDGLETAEKIRKSGREDAGTVIIIAMSANAFYDDIERSIKAGMNTHIAKPIDADELVNIIARQAGR
jgi:signal transduction histidine kinase/ActR/RegA family two-component response regulator